MSPEQNILLEEQRRQERVQIVCDAGWLCCLRHYVPLCLGFQPAPSQAAAGVREPRPAGPSRTGQRACQQALALPLSHHMETQFSCLFTIDSNWVWFVTRHCRVVPRSPSLYCWPATGGRGLLSSSLKSSSHSLFSVPFFNNQFLAYCIVDFSTDFYHLYQALQKKKKKKRVSYSYSFAKSHTVGCTAWLVYALCVFKSCPGMFHGLHVLLGLQKTQC